MLMLPLMTITLYGMEEKKECGGCKEPCPTLEARLEAAKEELLRCNRDALTNTVPGVTQVQKECLCLLKYAVMLKEIKIRDNNNKKQ